MGDGWATIAEGQPAPSPIWIVRKRAIRMAGGDREAIEHGSDRHICSGDDMIAIVVSGWVVYRCYSSVIAEQVAAEGCCMYCGVALAKRGLCPREATVDRHTVLELEGDRAVGASAGLIRARFHPYLIAISRTR